MTPASLVVLASCANASITGFSATDELTRAHIHDVRGHDGTLLRTTAGAWKLSNSAARIGYRVDLEGLARSADHFDVALRVGRSIVATASSFLLAPEPVGTDLRVSVTVKTAKGIDFVSALTKEGDGYQLDAHEIHVASYNVFGQFGLTRHMLRGQRGERSVLEVATLDGPLDMREAAASRWILDSARAVAEFWGGFPVPHALVVAVPVKARSGILFGKVLPESSPGIALVVGQHTRADRLYRDWVLVHELFHLGSPSFFEEGKWLDEGLATYYEPIIRARAGFYREREVWAEFVRAMPQGLRAVSVGGVEKAESYRSIYWGGAIVVLHADVEARRRSAGRQGLEDGLREMLARGGSASEVWSLSEAIETTDTALGAPILASLAQKHAFSGTPLNLEKLWAALGVVRTSRGIELRDDAPLSAIRKAMIWGGPPHHPLAEPRGGRHGS